MDAKFQWQEDVEDLEGYHRGGYHPVHVHDQYSDNRHQIIHKLGYGTCSTVWLARDLHQHRCVAIKILTADASEKSREAQILQRLNGGQGGGVHGGGKFVPTLLDQFEISGPNGRHLCLVTEPARCSIAASKEGRENWMFPLPIARALAAQAILALHKIHLHNVVHGDLHVRNLLLTLPNLDPLNDDEIYRQFGVPQTTTIERIDGCTASAEAPSYSGMPAQMAIDGHEIDDSNIMISDFGEAWFNDMEKRDTLQTPVLYLPPEATFEKSTIGQPADIWTLACTVYEIMGERPLFEGFMPDKDDIIAEILSALGPLPQQWRDSWPARNEFFHENGSWRSNMVRAHDPSRGLYH